MKKDLFLIGMLLIPAISFAQTENIWFKEKLKSNSEIIPDKISISKSDIYSLNIDALKKTLSTASTTKARNRKYPIISFPNGDGKMESFTVREESNFDSELASKYPDIKSYVGEGLENPNSKIYFSVSPLGLSSMRINGEKALFIEPYTKDLSTYVIYERSQKEDFNQFECGVMNSIETQAVKNPITKSADDGKLRTFRLALSCTGEYAAHFGGTKAGALAAMNRTMTRVNAIYERDLGIRMRMINNVDIIYTNPITDPYSDPIRKNDWNAQVQNTLTLVVGDSNYDIGHLFGANVTGGNAGGIGSVCINGSKGSGYTASTVPYGDSFDVDYVAHEMGHQFGANHTFSHSFENYRTNVEPGAGSTIMGYSGIVAGYEIQAQPDIYFHAISIQQITNLIKSRPCGQVTNLVNSVPTANAGLDYTIPRNTPFILTGVGTDADNDRLDYTWEQMDAATASETGINSAASGTKTNGPIFRSLPPANLPVRVFPTMGAILQGSYTTAGQDIIVEALPNVTRRLNFRFTVRDGKSNKSDDMSVAVNGAAGPFIVTSQNTPISLFGVNNMTVNWNVAGTTTNGVNCSKVDILWSSDNGLTWTKILSETPNDGTESIKVPNVNTQRGRIMVMGSNHIFFDVNNANITVNETNVDALYCPIRGKNTIEEKIRNVKFSTINNTSSDMTNGYQNFTNISANVVRGNSYPISITPAWKPSGVFPENYAVYIDINKDGTFSSNELVFSRVSTTSSIVTGNIVIPTDTFLGKTRMRVIMSRASGVPSPCGEFTFGEAEDYSLNIISSTVKKANFEEILEPNKSIDANVIGSVKLFPNPVTDILNISNVNDDDEYKIFNKGGAMISSGNIKNGSINVGHLITGVYTIQIGKIIKHFIKN